MGDSWIVDISHYEILADGPEDMSILARNVSEHCGAIVAAATSWDTPGMPIRSAIRCRRRPGRSPCSGRIVVVLMEDDDEIVWGCSHCDDRGVITNWRGSRWDLSLSHPIVGEGDTERVVEMRLTPQDHDVLVGLGTRDEDALRVIMSSLYSDETEEDEEGVDVVATVGDLDHLLGCVVAEGDIERRVHRLARLDCVQHKIASVLESEMGTDSDALV